MKIESVNSNRKTLSDSGEMRNSQGLRAGQTLHNGTYRIERVLGQGSFGITYLAKARFTTHGNLGEMNVEAQVAIKEFFMSEVNSRRADGSTVEGSTGSVFTNYRKKFKKEAENLAKLSHPNIVKVFDVFDENNTTYYVMEFLEGDNLDDYIKQHEHLTEQEAIDVICAVGSALDYMHSQKILHLDIKPKNIMHRSDGRNYLIDFGLSKQFTDDGEPESSTSIGLGTPGYSPIEQASYKQDGTFPATLDVYALGATMFKMLTGKRPPEATNILNEGFPTEELTQCGVSRQTVDAVERAMEPMKKKRYKNVRTFLNELDEGTVQVPDPIPVPVPKPNPKPKPTPVPEPEPEADDDDRLNSFSNNKWSILASVIIVIISLILGAYSKSRKSQSSGNTVNNSEYVEEADVSVDDVEYVEEAEPVVEAVPENGIEEIGQNVNQPNKSTTETIAELNRKGDEAYNRNIYSQAYKNYLKAAERGSARAQYMLGEMYIYGYGIKEDRAEAMKWYRKAAEGGNREAQNYIGYMYYREGFNTGISSNYVEAAKWFRKAAEQGLSSAQVHLGNLYKNGNGVSQDMEEAVKWYRKAAEQGHWSAQIELGKIYEEGTGVKQDKIEAIKWYRKAAAQGQESARKALTRLGVN